MQREREHEDLAVIQRTKPPSAVVAETETDDCDASLHQSVRRVRVSCRRQWHRNAETTRDIREVFSKVAKYM